MGSGPLLFYRYPKTCWGEELGGWEGQSTPDSLLVPEARTSKQAKDF